jgi:hypothetical protein
MVTKKYQKSKGSQFEYAVKETLEVVYLNQDPEHFSVYLTKELGYQKQYDISVIYKNKEVIAIECKKHKSISWNQAKKYYEKLEEKAKDAQYKILVFQSNRQPVLVMTRNEDGNLFVMEFKAVYGLDVRRQINRKI